MGMLAYNTKHRLSAHQARPVHAALTAGYGQALAAAGNLGDAAYTSDMANELPQQSLQGNNYDSEHSVRQSGGVYGQSMLC